MTLQASPEPGGPTETRGAHDPAVEPKRPEASLGDLLSEVTSEIGTLFRQEVDLAKLEAKEEATKAGKAGAMLGGAALCGVLALVMLSAALAWLLDEALDRSLAFAIVGALWTLLAIVLQRVGRSRLARVRALPKTRETIKEDVEWAAAQTS